MNYLQHCSNILFSSDINCTIHNPCQNGGNCTINSNSNNTCTCALGYGGSDCAISELIAFLFAYVDVCENRDVNKGM